MISMVENGILDYRNNNWFIEYVDKKSDSLVYVPLYIKDTLYLSAANLKVGSNVRFTLKKYSKNEHFLLDYHEHVPYKLIKNYSIVGKIIFTEQVIKREETVGSFIKRKRNVKNM